MFNTNGHKIGFKVNLDFFFSSMLIKIKIYLEPLHPLEWPKMNFSLQYKNWKADRAGDWYLDHGPRVSPLSEKVNP